MYYEHASTSTWQHVLDCIIANIPSSVIAVQAKGLCLALVGGGVAHAQS
jgi:hypothetical protein